MARKEIFTRDAINAIMANEELTPQQRTEQVFALYGRALDDGYISKSAAQQAQQTALEKAKEDWEKEQQAPDVTQSEPYIKLRGEFDDYKTMQAARSSDDYKRVKGKFFETVYNLVDHSEGAKPVGEQLQAIEEKYDEYFNPAEPANSKPTFGAPVEGSMPKGNKGAAEQFSQTWGFAPKKRE